MSLTCPDAPVEADPDLPRQVAAIRACRDRFRARRRGVPPVDGLELGAVAIPAGAVAFPASELPTPADPRVEAADRRAIEAARRERSRRGR